MRAVLLGLLLVTLIFTGCSNKNIVEGSVEQISNINQADNRDDLALHDAIRAKDLNTASLLIKAQSPINTKDEHGYTPLHLTSIYDQVEIAKLLINNAAQVNTEDDYNDTPLLDAARNNYYKMSRLLVCNSAQRNAKDKNGLTPLHYASQAKNAELVQLLLSNDLELYCQHNLEITVDAIEESTETSLPFCGALKEGVASSVTVELTDAFKQPVQTLEASINKNEKSWCTPMSQELPLGDYTLKATAKDKADNVHEVNTTFSIIEKIIEEPVMETTLTQTIYDALMAEFKEDFPKWKAALDSKSLVLGFGDEATFFSRGYSQIPQKYETILADFFPRYIKVLEPFQQDIKVLIQGHTSSVFESANDKKIKFMKNEILSQKRADNVYAYVQTLENETIMDNKTFLENDTKSIAKASLETIKNEDMTENYLLSRRVDFKVEVLNESSSVKATTPVIEESVVSEEPLSNDLPAELEGSDLLQ